MVVFFFCVLAPKYDGPCLPPEAPRPRTCRARPLNESVPTWREIWRFLVMVGLWLLGFGWSQYVTITIVCGCRIVSVVVFFWPQVLDLFFTFFPSTICLCICKSFELEPVILHSICYILAWSLCILHGICYIWPWSPSVLHGICHILAC